MNRGFTLIELLVVIAIIGLLASVVLASVTTAELKGTDGAIKGESAQLRTLMNEEYGDNGSYANVQLGSQSTGHGTGWLQSGDACTGAAGTYASQVNTICSTLVKDTGTICGANCVYFWAVSPPTAAKFTIISYLPGASAAAGSARWLCMGSSGRSSITTSNAGAWTDPGCYANP
jgi:type IV pilus assembly protein PilA